MKQRKKPSAEQMCMFCKFLNAEFKRKIRVEQSIVKAMLKKYGFGSLNYLLPEMEKAFFIKEKISTRVYYILRNNMSSIEPKSVWLVIDNTLASIRKYYAGKNKAEDKQEKIEEIEEIFVSFSDFLVVLRSMEVSGIIIKNGTSMEEIVKNKAFSFVKKVETYEKL